MVIEIEEITTSERIHNIFLLFVAFYVGKLLVRTYYHYIEDGKKLLQNEQELTKEQIKLFEETLSGSKSV